MRPNHPDLASSNTAQQHKIHPTPFFLSSDKNGQKSVCSLCQDNIQRHKHRFPQTKQEELNRAVPSKEFTQMMVLQYQKHARLHFERSPSCFTCDFDSIHCVIHYIVLLLNGVGGYHQASNSHNNDEKQRAFCCRVLIIIKCNNHPSEALVLPSLLLVL